MTLKDEQYLNLGIRVKVKQSKNSIVKIYFITFVFILSSTFEDFKTSIQQQKLKSFI